MADGLHYYEWYFNDWLGSGTRADMSLHDRAIYRDLLDHQAASGSLPDDACALANRALCSTGQMESFMQRWGDRLFPLGGDGARRNEKLQANRDAIVARLNKRRSAGVEGAKARWKNKRNGKANGKRIADAMASQNQNQNQSNTTEEPNGSSCADADKPRSPASDIRWCTTADGGWVGITEKDMSDWSEAYPACDIRRQLLRMDQWLQANPKKAKKSRWRNFIINWLKREQDRGGDTASNRPNQSTSGAAGNQARGRREEEARRQGAESITPKLL